MSEKTEKVISSSAASDGSPAVGEIHDLAGDGVNNNVHLSRVLGSRHLVFFSIGSSIGLGLWLGSGTALARGGPAALFLAFCWASSVVFAVTQATGELAVMYPVPSAFPQWAGKFIDTAPAVTLGWSYWFAATMSVASELTGLVTVLHYWTSAVPTAAWISIFLALLIFLNAFNVKVFGEAEVFMSALKLGWMVIVIIVCIVISAGGGPIPERTGFRYWNEELFTNGFKGFLAVLPTCVFSMGGSEISGLSAAEAKNPLKAVPRAVSSIWLRLGLFYVLGSLMTTIVVSPHNPDLFGASGVNASPYVIAFHNAGLPGLAYAMNVIILISVFSCGNGLAYAASRIPFGMAKIGLVPKFLGWADKSGRPWPGLAMTFAVGGGLAYLNVSTGSATVFTWLMSLTTLCILFNWSIICLSHIRFRRAWAKQGHTAEELPWQMPFYPYTSYYGLACCIIMFVVDFYLAVWPLGLVPSARNFFSRFLSGIALLVLYIVAKIYFRGRLYIKSEDVDLDTRRAHYSRDLEVEAATKST